MTLKIINYDSLFIYLFTVLIIFLSVFEADEKINKWKFRKAFATSVSLAQGKLSSDIHKLVGICFTKPVKTRGKFMFYIKK